MKKILLVLSLILIPGLALTKPRGDFNQITQIESSLKRPRSVLTVPIVLQKTSYSCGAAAFLSVVKYFGLYSGSEKNLYPILGTTPENGTPPDGLLKGAWHFQLEAEVRENLTIDDLRQIIRDNGVAILDIQAWTEQKPPVDWANTWDDGHYVVLVGIDQKYIFVMDPSLSEPKNPKVGWTYGYIPLPEFEKRWHDYEVNPDGSRREYRQTAIIFKNKRSTEKLPRQLVPQFSRVF